MDCSLNADGNSPKRHTQCRHVLTLTQCVSWLRDDVLGNSCIHCHDIRQLKNNWPSNNTYIVFILKDMMTNDQMQEIHTFLLEKLSFDLTHNSLYLKVLCLEIELLLKT